MEDVVTTIKNYFLNEMGEGKIDFSLRVMQVENGLQLTIHPSGKDGKTIDLLLREETYKQTYLTTK